MRSNRWLRGWGIVVVGAGLVVGAGHGLANAEPDVSGGATESANSSESDQSTEVSIVAEHDGTQRDSPETKDPKKPTSIVSAATVTVKKDLDVAESAQPIDDHETADPSPPRSSKRTEAVARSALPAAHPEPATPLEVDQPSTTTSTTTSAPSPTQPAAAAVEVASVTPTPTMAAPPPPNLLNVIGTLLFTVLTLPLKLFEQTPVLPPGYSVTVGRSTLDVGCGCGQSVDTRWYFPDPEARDGSAPQSLIYLQHGFFRSNSALSAMAIELSERTNSVVVTPTLTSNFFAADGCWINGEPMQRAVADLFVGARTALTQSALAAGWTGGALPPKFILSGQSAGGVLAAAAAGFAVDHGGVSDLLLVVMFDGVPFGDFLPAALAKLGSGPVERQVLQIASPPYFVNLFGSGTDQLVAARPGQFVGVQLVGGLHADAEGPSSDVIAQLAAGFSRPENVKAVQTIAVGWINDVLGGIPAGVGAPLGGTITIPTTQGDATALILGSPTTTPPTPVGKELFTQNRV